MNLWRHPLAHDPFPIFQMDKKTEYHPCPKWCADASAHLRIRNSDEGYPDWPGERAVRYMDLGLLNLLDDVRGAIVAYVAELDEDEAMQRTYDQRFQEEQSKEYKAG